MAVVVKRVYDPPAGRDGLRVLVDRLWPRGLSKEKAEIDHWLKDIAPSDELRKWYHARPTQWTRFREKYLAELSQPELVGFVSQLHELSNRNKTLTLLFASRNLDHNNATVLKELLDGARKPPRSTGGGAAAAIRKSARAR
jgi:uncharacterized protein YeaO (DUF488 family)